MKADEKSYKKVLIYLIGNVRFKYLRYTKINSVDLLYLNVNKIS